MKCVNIVDNGDFVYRVYINLVQDLRGMYDFKITSQYKSAKDADAEQVKFQCLVDNQGLLALQSLVYDSVFFQVLGEE